MNDHEIDKNNQEHNSDRLNKEIPKNQIIEANSTLEKKNEDNSINNESEHNVSTDNDVMFVDETPVNINIVKNEPDEGESTTTHSKMPTSETTVYVNIKTEAPSPEPCNDVVNNEDISVKTINKSDVIQQNNVNKHYNQTQCSFCKVHFNVEEYAEHAKHCHGGNSRPNTNTQESAEMDTGITSTSRADLHTTLDLEIKNEPENGENSTTTGNEGNPASKLRTKSKTKRATSDGADVIPCEICDDVFPTSLDFALHSIVHSDDDKYHCLLCDHKTRSVYNFKIHVRSHDEIKHMCEVCKEEFTDKTEADEHKYLHTGETPYECETCGKRFMFSWLLNSHRRSKHWEVLMGIPIPKYDPNAIHYKHHIYSTMDIRRHKHFKGTSALTESDLTVLCEICGKRLSSMERLKFHLRVHTGYKPFVCSYCAKPFSRREQLREHERVHTGERPYICRFCGKGFTQRSPLRIHERMHTGERPYQCRLCGKGYVSKGAVDIHMKTCKGK